MANFKDLHFDRRPDLTPYLLHLTKRSATDGWTAFENLQSILLTGIINGSDNSGFVKGPNTAACFMDVPFAALKYVLNMRDAGSDTPRYEPYGIFIHKKYAYSHGCRPVMYLSNTELRKLRIPDDERWRVVRLEANDTSWISWLHEREWRCKGDFSLPTQPIGALVKNTKDLQKLSELIQEETRRVRRKAKEHPTFRRNTAGVIDRLAILGSHCIWWLSALRSP
jgi:hypothetical protein